MTVIHPEVKKIIREAQGQIRQLTGNNTLYLIVENHSGIYIEFDQLVDTVCHVTGVSYEQVMLAGREIKIRRTRQLIAFYGYDCCRMTLKALGDKLGGQDHSTIMHSRRKIKELIETSDPQVCGYVSRINEMIGCPAI